MEVIQCLRNLSWDTHYIWVLRERGGGGQKENNYGLKLVVPKEGGGGINEPQTSLKKSVQKLPIVKILQFRYLSFPPIGRGIVRLPKPMMEEKESIRDTLVSDGHKE